MLGHKYIYVSLNFSEENWSCDDAQHFSYTPAKITRICNNHLYPDMLICTMCGSELLPNFRTKLCVKLNLFYTMLLIKV